MHHVFIQKLKGSLQSFISKEEAHSNRLLTIWDVNFQDSVFLLNWTFNTNFKFS